MPPIEFETAQKYDYCELSSFLSSSFNRPAALWFERFGLLWESNPAFSQDWTRGILARDRSRIVGFIGQFPTRFQVSGKEVLASNSTSLAVHPEYRKLGLGLQLRSRQLRLDKNIIVFATTPNAVSQKLNRFLKLQAIPRKAGSAGGQTAVVPVSPVGTLAFLFAQTYKLSPTTALKATMTAMPIVFRFSNRFFNTWLGSTSPDIQIRDVTHPDEEFDVLWERTRSNYSNTNIRTAEVLRWYLTPTTGTRRHLYAAYLADTLIGFAVFLEKTHRKYSAMKILVCADMWCSTADSVCFDRFLSHALEHARKLRCSCILLPHHFRDIAALHSPPSLPDITGWMQHEFIRIPSHLSNQIGSHNSCFSYLQGDRGIL